MMPAKHLETLVRDAISPVMTVQYNGVGQYRVSVRPSDLEGLARLGSRDAFKWSDELAELVPIGEDVSEEGNRYERRKVLRAAFRVLDALGIVIQEQLSEGA